MTDFIDEIMAKSDGETTLEMHTKHVLNASISLLNKLPFTDEDKKYWMPKLQRCVIMHDIGKILPEFQKSLNGDRSISIRHEIISLWFCENFLNIPIDETFAIATHHKGIVKSGEAKRLEWETLKEHMNYFFVKNKEILSQKILLEWLTKFDIDINPVEKKLNTEISQHSIKLLSYNYQRKIIPDINSRKELSLMRTLLMSSDHIGSARFEGEIPEYKRIEIKDFQPANDGKYFEFRDFQKQLQSVKTDVILHAPTGSGKTEAALGWVWANQKVNSRLYYLLPYTASINAMVVRLQNIFGQKKVTALHSKTLDFFYDMLINEESNKDTTDYQKLEKEARDRKSFSKEIFHPVKVATLHQILKVALKGKGWEFGIIDYRNALFIIDEFHTYNALLTGLLLSAIKLFKRLFNAKFLFMSATIPDFMLNHIVEYIFDGNEDYLIRPNPNIYSDKEILGRKRHRLICQPKSTIRDKIDLLHSYLEKNFSILIIVNNVKTAQQLYSEISLEDTNNVALLHSGFHKKGRIDIEQRITNKDLTKRPKLLIATQAVEVSLDIDYDIAFIENAPIDALIQRFGRVNRAGKKGIAPIFLFEEIIGSTKFFYDENVLKSTWNNLLPFHEQDLSENDLVDICNIVYAAGYNEVQRSDFEKGLNNSTIKSFEEEWVAGDWNDWIDSVMEENNQKVEILCENLIPEFDRLKEQKRYIEANQLLVNVFRYELQKTVFNLDKSRNAIVAYDFIYDPQIGYQREKVSFEEQCL